MNMPDDPARLADAAPRSPVGELLASASRDLPSEAQLARLAAQLGPVLGGPTAAKAPSGTSLRVGLGVAAGALVLLVGAGLALRRPTHTTAAGPTAPPKVADARPPVPAPEPPPVSAPALPPPSPPTPDDSSSSQPSDSPRAVGAKSASVPGKAPSEAALLEQARRALDTAPGYALQLANQHRALFPRGVLTQEREVIAIEALRRLHRAAEADQRATGFSKAFPGSAHQRRVDEVAPK